MRSRTLTENSFRIERYNGGNCLRGRINLVRDLSFQIISACATVFALAALQGCATMSEADCLTTDWTVLGEVDGQRGRPLSEINRYRRQCAEYGVVPDTQAYVEARERGLAVYCTTSNGYREGRTGVRDDLVCPLALAPDFQRGHQLGQAVFTSLNRLRNDSASIRSARNEIENLRSEIDDREASLRDDDLTDEQARTKRDEIDSMDRRIDQLQDGMVIQSGTLALAIADYRRAVEAARSEGFDEPMESELIRELGQLTR